MSRKLGEESTRPPHATLAVVLQVRAGSLQALLWQRARAPFKGAWALPGGLLAPGETLEASIRRHLEAKVDVRELSHLEQLATYGDPGRDPSAWSSRRPTSASSSSVSTRTCRTTRVGTPSTSSPQTAYDHGAIVLAARERLRGKLSYSNAGFALAPPEFTLAELREVYVAALGHEVSATNLRRVLERRHVIEPTGERRPSGRAGGRPAEVFRFRDRSLAITDPFAALRPRR